MGLDQVLRNTAGRDQQRLSVGTRELQRNKERLKQRSALGDTEHAHLCRFEPRLQWLMEEMLKGCLSEQDYPHIPNTGPKSARPPPRTAGADADTQKSGRGSGIGCAGNSNGEPRLVIFIIGGIALPEVRTA